MATARLLPLLLLAACQDPTNEKLMDLLDDYDYERDGTRTLLCDCPSALGFATTEECEQDVGDLGSSEKACIVKAFEGHDELAVDYFSCIVPIQRSFGLCLVDYFGCAPDWFATCDEMKDMEAIDTCPGLPLDVAEAYVECF